MIQPSDLGAPGRFEHWRPQQAQAFAKVVGASTPYVLGAIPLGVGKSLIGWASAKLLGARAVYLTSTKGLMQQISETLPSAAIMGMGNYPCRALMNTEMCDSGPCLDGEECIWKKGGCAYFDKEAIARQFDISVTNYDYWFSHPDKLTEGPILGARDMLICDEAHDIPMKLMKAAGVEFNSGEVELDPSMETWTLDQWSAWAVQKWAAALDLLSSPTLAPSDRRDVRSLLVRFDRLAKADTPTWAWEWTIDLRGGVTIRFEPITPKGLADHLLFRGIPKVIFLSGTARREMMDELGIPPELVTYVEVPSPFPVQRRPIYWWETGVRLNQHTSGLNLEFLVNKIDQIISTRKGHKGIIHTVSYARAKYLMKNSRYAHYMMMHTSDSTRATVDRFKRSKAPAILISPSVDTGWDFPYDAARWQIIMKVPFPNTATGIAHARAQRDNQYGQKHAIVTLQQMVGRLMRAEDDWGETFIVDDTMKYLYRHFRPWFHKWFREAYSEVANIPKALDFPS